MKGKPIIKPIIKPLIKAIVRSSRGYPVYKPTVSTIDTCKCGKRYIKTRPNQDACIPCFVKAK